MRKILPPEIEAKRIKMPDFPPGSGPNGFFVIRGPTGADLRILASDGLDGLDGPEAGGFEHVSVSVGHRIPNWQEMCKIKELFWEDHEAVYQLHPPKAEWVNNHPRVLHLWRHPTREVPMPPPLTVGIKDDGTYANAREAAAGFLRAQQQGKI